MRSSFLLVLLSIPSFGCKKIYDHYNPDKDDSQGKNYTGFIYTSTNATAGNAIIALMRI